MADKRVKISGGDTPGSKDTEGRKRTAADEKMETDSKPSDVESKMASEDIFGIGRRKLARQSPAFNLTGKPLESNEARGNSSDEKLHWKVLSRAKHMAAKGMQAVYNRLSPNKSEECSKEKTAPRTSDQSQLEKWKRAISSWGKRQSGDRASLTSYDNQNPSNEYSSSHGVQGEGSSTKNILEKCCDRIWGEPTKSSTSSSVSNVPRSINQGELAGPSAVQCTTTKNENLKYEEPVLIDLSQPLIITDDSSETTLEWALKQVEKSSFATESSDLGAMSSPERFKEKVHTSSEDQMDEHVSGGANLLAESTEAAANAQSMSSKQEEIMQVDGAGSLECEEKDF